MTASPGVPSSGARHPISTTGVPSATAGRPNSTAAPVISTAGPRNSAAAPDFSIRDHHFSIPVLPAAGRRLPFASSGGLNRSRGEPNAMLGQTRPHFEGGQETPGIHAATPGDAPARTGEPLATPGGTFATPSGTTSSPPDARSTPGNPAATPGAPAGSRGNLPGTRGVARSTRGKCHATVGPTLPRHGVGYFLRKLRVFADFLPPRPSEPAAVTASGGMERRAAIPCESLFETGAGRAAVSRPGHGETRKQTDSPVSGVERNSPAHSGSNGGEQPASFSAEQTTIFWSDAPCPEHSLSRLRVLATFQSPVLSDGFRSPGWKTRRTRRQECLRYEWGKEHLSSRPSRSIALPRGFQWIESGTSRKTTSWRLYRQPKTILLSPSKYVSVPPAGGQAYPASTLNPSLLDTSLPLICANIKQIGLSSLPTHLLKPLQRCLPLLGFLGLEGHEIAASASHHAAASSNTGHGCTSRATRRESLRSAFRRS